MIYLDSQVTVPGPIAPQGLTYAWSLTYQGGGTLSGTTVTGDQPNFSFPGDGSDLYPVQLEVIDNYHSTGSTRPTWKRRPTITG